MAEGGKPLFWVGTSKEDLKAFPEDVQDVMGYALHLAQQGGKHKNAKPLKGYKGAGVLEIVDDFQGDTWRAVYTVRLGDAVYALHAFQKKSKKGRATDKSDLRKIEQRLKLAEADHEARRKERERNG